MKIKSFLLIPVFYCPFIIIFCFGLLSCKNDSQNLKIVVAGDLMLDRGVRHYIEKNGIEYLFEDVKKIFSASDISIVNFECTASNVSLDPAVKKFTFQACPEWLAALNNIGITHVTLANNHSFDFGEDGIRQTAANLKKHGINYIGYNSENNSACLPAIIEKKGNTIAVFSCTFLKQESPSVCSENIFLLAERIKAFKAIYQTSVVFACLHWGVELKETPTIEQIEQAHLLIDSGTDVIVGHHPHVVQNIEIYKGKYIFYSMGNFIFDNNREPADKGILAEFSFLNNSLENIRVIPFDIIKAKPVTMNSEEGKKFMNKIKTLSPTVTFKEKENAWQLCRL